MSLIVAESKGIEVVFEMPIWALLMWAVIFGFLAVLLLVALWSEGYILLAAPIAIGVGAWIWLDGDNQIGFVVMAVSAVALVLFLLFGFD